MNLAATLTDDVPMDDRIFICHIGEGICYSDKTVNRNGDYARLAFLDYDTLTLDVDKRCPKVLQNQIRDHAATYKVGQVLTVSGSGQTRLLGRRLIQKTT